MIKNKEALQRFEKELIRKEKVDIFKNFRLLEAMYKEAVLMGQFPPKDPLSGLEVDLKIAKAVNSVSRDPSLDKNCSARFKALKEKIKKES